MVVDCPMVIVSIGDTLFQARNKEKLIKQVFCKVDTGSCTILVPKKTGCQIVPGPNIKLNKIAFISDRVHVETSTMTIKTASKLHFFAAGSHDYPFPLPATKSSKTSLPKLRKGKGQFMIRLTFTTMITLRVFLFYHHLMIDQTEFFKIFVNLDDLKLSTVQKKY